MLRVGAFEEDSMLRMRVLVPLFLGLAYLIALLGLTNWARADLEAQETGLNPAGDAYELNLDSQGMLWISDYSAGEIWRVDPSAGSYTIFEVGGNPSDARSDGAGLVWWADFSSNQLGRLSVAEGEASIWEIPGTTSLYGTGLDAGGNTWVTDASGPYLYRLAPGSSEVCTYTLPLDGLSDYLVVDGSQVWLGDWLNSRIDRLDTVSETVTWWELPAGSYPEGMALDGNGNLWWADPNLGELARLEPGANRLITYTQSVVQHPVMISVAGEQVWYTDQSQSVGMLDPRLDPGTVITIPHSSELASPSCAPQLPPTTHTVTVTNGLVTWNTATYTTLFDQNGWQVFQLPTGSSPWGIAAEDSVWIVDTGRRVLARIGERRVYLPLILR